jgi:hypothetical protein
MSLLLATQITAVATAVLAVFAVVTAWYARRAYQGQSAELTLLQEQAGRDIGQRRRAQAAKVFVTVGGRPPLGRNTVQMHNASEQPIYDLVASWAENADPVRLPFLLPCDLYGFVAEWQDADGNMPPVWLEFRDAAGLRWRTTSRGELGELP